MTNIGRFVFLLVFAAVLTNADTINQTYMPDQIVDRIELYAFSFGNAEPHPVLNTFHFLNPAWESNKVTDRVAYASGPDAGLLDNQFQLNVTAPSLFRVDLFGYRDGDLIEFARIGSENGGAAPLSFTMYGQPSSWNWHAGTNENYWTLNDINFLRDQDIYMTGAAAVAPVPEPGGMALMGMGLCSVALLCRRCRFKQTQ